MDDSDNPNADANFDVSVLFSSPFLFLLQVQYTRSCDDSQAINQLIVQAKPKASASEVPIYRSQVLKH